VPRVWRVIIWATLGGWCLPHITHTQQTIAVIKTLEAKPYEEAFQGFREALAARGYRPSLSEYTFRDGQGDEARILPALKAQRPALLVTLGSAATSLAQAYVQDIPVVFCMVLNPVASGFVQSLPSSGNNLTGASLDVPARVQFETLKAVLPRVKRVGVLYNPRETAAVVEPAIQAAAEVGLELIAMPVTAAEQIPSTLAGVERHIDALWSVADSTVFASDRAVEFLLRQTLQYRLPFMGLSSAFVKAGALLALSVDYRNVGRQCGEQAALVLAGRAPASLPITTPRTVTLYVNLNVATAIGVEIPASAMAEAVILR
jgi:putative ABC transport system substrate-binding protein